ncbi:MAG: hypothetical protein CK520_04600, partial [Actinobacteria bacterium]
MSEDRLHRLRRRLGFVMRSFSKVFCLSLLTVALFAGSAGAVAPPLSAAEREVRPCRKSKQRDETKEFKARRWKNEDWSYCSWKSYDLRATEFGGTNLTGADLSDTNLSGADLADTNL